MRVTAGCAMCAPFGASAAKKTNDQRDTWRMAFGKVKASAVARSLPDSVPDQSKVARRATREAALLDADSSMSTPSVKAALSLKGNQEGGPPPPPPPPSLLYHLSIDICRSISVLLVTFPLLSFLPSRLMHVLVVHLQVTAAVHTCTVTIAHTGHAMPCRVWVCVCVCVCECVCVCVSVCVCVWVL